MTANSRALQRNDCKVNIHVIVLVLHYASPHQYSYVREVKVTPRILNLDTTRGIVSFLHLAFHNEERDVGVHWTRG
jgi:hypothetical protein